MFFCSITAQSKRFDTKGSDYVKVQILEKYVQVGRKVIARMIGLQVFTYFSTQLGANWGIRDLPDKCICDTNAYLARNGRKLLHPSGCLYYLNQGEEKDHRTKMAGVLQGGVVYE